MIVPVFQEEMAPVQGGVGVANQGQAAAAPPGAMRPSINPYAGGGGGGGYGHQQQQHQQAPANQQPPQVLDDQILTQQGRGGGDWKSALDRSFIQVFFCVYCSSHAHANLVPA